MRRRGVGRASSTVPGEKIRVAGGIRAARMTGAPVSYLQLFVTEGAGGGLPWRKDCRALNLFKRGDRLQ